MKHADLCYFHMQLTWLDWSRSRSCIVFGLGLITDFWSRSRSRSRTLWSRSWPWSHYVLVSLTSLGIDPEELMMLMMIACPNHDGQFFITLFTTAFFVARTIRWSSEACSVRPLGHISQGTTKALVLSTAQWFCCKAVHIDAIW